MAGSDIPVVFTNEKNGQKPRQTKSTIKVLAAELIRFV